MRLKITLDAGENQIPFEYHRYLQAVIYRALKKDTGDFFHNKGYGEKRIFKMFVYSELMGKYKVENGHLIFMEPVCFYISSVSKKMLKELFIFFDRSEYIYFNETPLKILNVFTIEDIAYHENKRYELQTVSPIVCYKTDDKRFTTFFHPKSREFEEALKMNLKRKYNTLYGREPGNEIFELIDVIRYKKSVVKYKKFIYEAYFVTMKTYVSDEYLKLLMHTGLGARNSAGFGMMQINKK